MTEKLTMFEELERDQLFGRSDPRYQTRFPGILQLEFGPEPEDPEALRELLVRIDTLIEESKNIWHPPHGIGEEDI